MSPFDKLRLEALGHKYSAGGHISYIETDSLTKNLEAIPDILRYAKMVGIHYMGINQPVDKMSYLWLQRRIYCYKRRIYLPTMWKP